MKNQKGFGLVEGILIVLVISALGFGGYYVWNQQQESQEREKEISALNENLENANTELSEAEMKIQELDNPEKKARDEERKSDLNRFIA